MVELAVEQDEETMMEYLEGTEPTLAKLKQCIRRGTLDFKFTPIVTGTAFKNKGVQVHTIHSPPYIHYIHYTHSIPFTH